MQGTEKSRPQDDAGENYPKVDAGCVGPVVWIFFSATCALYMSHTHNLSWPIGVGFFFVQAVLGLLIGLCVVEVMDRVRQKSIDAFLESGGLHIVPAVMLWFAATVLFAPAFVPFRGMSIISKLRVMFFGFLIFLGGLILALGPLIIWYKCRKGRGKGPK